ncbi:MAG: hypothetical protein CMA64_10010 [Euryarchaeota archaeon]|jgi:hypothetical protein|nr:hypothetical protein [Euryarchaeota archaeon]
MGIEDLVEVINKYGFPIVAAVGMGYFIWFIYQWVTKTIKPVLSSTTVTLIALIDRIRMLDNDMIRLTVKLNMILEGLEEKEKRDNDKQKNGRSGNKGVEKSK